MRTISLKLPEALEARLAQSASLAGTTKSAILRDALQAFLEGGRSRGRASAHDLAKDLIGRFRGARDLSSNPKHLRGYGR